MAASTPAAAFNTLALSCHLPDKFRLMLIHLCYGTIPLFASIDSGLCTPAPTAQALQEVVQLCTLNYPALQFDADDIRRLRGFAMSCGHAMDDAQKSGLQGLGLGAPPPSPVPAGGSSPAPDQPDTDRTMARVAARQWEADRRVYGGRPSRSPAASR